MKHSQKPSFIEKTKTGVKSGFIKNSFYKQHKNLNILLDTLKPDQASYFALVNTSKYLTSHGFVGISLYVDEITNPVFYPLTAIFSSNDLQNLDEPVIVTSLKTLDLALSYDAKKIYYYVYNIHELFYIDKNKLEILKNKKILFFTRNDDYRQILMQHFKLDCSKILVPDFNMEQMEKVIE
jgi:hypothetical protein